MAKTPFAHLLLYVRARELSGTLAIWPEPHGGKSGQDRILFEAGELLAMRPVEPAKTLYAALMPLFAREAAPYGFYEGHNLLGQTGFLQEPVDINTLLSRGLRVHVNEAFMDSVLERVRGRTLRLRDGAPLDRLELNPRELSWIEPLRSGTATLDTLIGSGVLPERDAKRALYLLTLVRAIEAAEGKGSIPAVEMDSFPPQPDDEGKLVRGTLGDAPGPLVSSDRRPTGAPTISPPMRTVSAPAAPASSPGTAARSGAEPRVSGVAKTSVVEQTHSPEPANQNDRSPSAPPAPLGLSSADEARWNELTQLYARIDALHHYDLLQVPRTATPQELETSYYALVKKFHPDRLPLSLAPLLRAAQVLFERLTEAHETLSNPQLRADYDKAVAGGGGTREADRTMRNVLESALEFQKAEVLVRRREYTQAMQLLRSAIAKTPDEADYHALYAWILHLTNPSLPAPLDDMLRSLDRALKSNPRHERAHYYRGVILKRLKRDNEAVRHFKAAAELNPHNVDAAREVRLAVMRRDSKPPPGGQGNVLSRLFKK
ncbi:MAG: heat shock protein DnaJ domain protein [Myxococcaceae bacterium]|nr:heat shock protein DnaJ domain protein [Myxococcaceae bacterium]